MTNELVTALYLALVIAAAAFLLLFLLPWAADQRRKARERAKEAKRNRMLKANDPLGRDR